MVLPSDQVQTVMSSGLSAIRPMRSPNVDDPDGWNFGSARMPSYQAYGRMRAVYSVIEAERLRPQRVLEIAAGDGALCASLQHRLGCQVFANDLRVDNLRKCLEAFSNGSQVKIVPGNIFEISPDSVPAADLVVALEIIEHVAHGVDFLRHLSRFLAPGGRILLTTPNGSHFRNRLPGYYEIPDHSALESAQFKPDADGHLFLVRPDELHRMAAEAGLIVESMNLWGTPFVTGHAALHRFGAIIPQRFCLAMERMLSNYEKMCFNMSAVLKPNGN